MLVLERHQVHVVLAPDDEDALPRITVGAECSRMSSRLPRSMWNTPSSNPMPRSFLSFAFFASSQAKYFTDIGVSRGVLDSHTLRRLQCARQCAQTRSKIGQTAATANQATNKKRA